MFKTMMIRFLVSTICVGTLTACEKQKQATPEVGATPKTILDKAKKDINSAQARDTEKLKATESETNL